MRDVTWVIEQGAVGGFPATGFAFGCALNPQALIQSVDQFTLLQGGGFDVAMLSFLEVSGPATSMSPIWPPGRMSPPAWAASTTSSPGRPRSFTPATSPPARRISKSPTASSHRFRRHGRESSSRVAQVSFSGEMARRRRQDVLYITERCVIQLTEAGLMVIEIAPGVDLNATCWPRPTFRCWSARPVHRRIVPARTDGIDLVPEAVPDRPLLQRRASSPGRTPTDQPTTHHRRNPRHGRHPLRLRDRRRRRRRLRRSQPPLRRPQHHRAATRGGQRGTGRRWSTCLLGSPSSAARATTGSSPLFRSRG